MSALLQLTEISRRFGAVQALHDASFLLQPGEVHALLGENGAGKSTLMRIANGMLRPDSGEYLVNGQTAQPRSPRDARALGIGMVHQHFSAVPAFSVQQNIALAAGWSPDRRTLQARVVELIHRVGLTLDPEQSARDLTVAQRQALEILMALAGDAHILLLDEPTAVLTSADAEQVLGVVRQFATRGRGVVLITHKLEEALAHSDRITVLRGGRVTLTGNAKDQTADSLAQAMLGEAPPRGIQHAVAQAGGVVAWCEAVTAPPDAGGTGLTGASLQLRSGEMVGIAAVEGNGERELLRILAGVLTAHSGHCSVQGRRTLIPADRTTEALIPAFSLTENRELAADQGPVWIDWMKESSATEALIAASGTGAPGATAAAAQLSGGNQQRFVVARQLEARPALIVAENPTRGLDLKATIEVFDQLRQAARNGAGVIFHSADLDEVLAQADRVVVLHRGRVLDPPPNSDRGLVGRMMLTGTRMQGG